MDKPDSVGQRCNSQRDPHPQPSDLECGAQHNLSLDQKAGRERWTLCCASPLCVAVTWRLHRIPRWTPPLCVAVTRWLHRIPRCAAPLDVDTAAFEKIIKDTPFVMVNYFAPWCFWSNRLSPTWLEVTLTLTNLARGNPNPNPNPN